MNKEIRKEKKKLQKDTCYNKVENISTGKKENQSVLQKAKDEYNKMCKDKSKKDRRIRKEGTSDFDKKIIKNPRSKNLKLLIIELQYWI